MNINTHLYFKVGTVLTHHKQEIMLAEAVH